MRRGEVTTGPAKLLAIMTASSPTVRTSTSGPSPRETIVTPEAVPPYPRDRMPTRRPRAARLRLDHNVNGVLPVPPTDRLPMLITGSSARHTRRRPIR